jgi:hypothetical protein
MTDAARVIVEIEGISQLRKEVDRIAARFDDAPLFAFGSEVGPLRSGLQYRTPVHLMANGFGFTAEWSALDANRVELRLRGPQGQPSRYLIFQWEGTE